METTQIKKASEEYAKKYMENKYLRGINGSYKLGFKQGAEWALNQYKWINQKERLPEESKEYLVVIDNGDMYVALYNNNHKSWFVYGIGYTDNVTHYMPIPSFDEILEANGDVLERIKEKGD
ncbi:DUF551 domain-containing protein [Coprobacter sp.]|uniref:DUF551 domain-containing protein n=1 Tax=Coprobacter sp. TaxID=1941478 RepID=UPI003AB8F286